VLWKARISASQVLTVRASRDSSATPTPSHQWEQACQRPAGIGGAVGGVDAAQQLLALPGGHHLTGRVTESKPSPQPHSSPLVSCS